MYVYACMYKLTREGYVGAMYVEGRHTLFREYHNTRLSYVISLDRSLSPLGIGDSSQGKDPGNEVHSHQSQNSSSA